MQGKEKGGDDLGDLIKKGVPLRIDIGPRDIANDQVCVVRRDTGEKINLPMAELGKVKEMLDDVQQNLFNVAKQKRDACVEVTKTWDEFNQALGSEIEEKRGDRSRVKTLSSPFEQPEMPKGTSCFVSGKPAEKWTYQGRSY